MREVKPGSSVYVMDDVISDELCETIRIVLNNVNNLKVEDYSVKTNVKCKFIMPLDLENKKFGGILDKEIYNVVSGILKRALSEDTTFTSAGKWDTPGVSSFSSDCGYTLRKIHGATRLHVDDIFGGTPDLKEVRKLSLIIALNSDYDGGEFYFPNQGIDKIKLKKGQAILFPPYWTHPHGTKELNNETFRYTINTWLHE